MARKSKTQPPAQVPAIVEAPAQVPSQDVVLPAVAQLGKPQMADDMKAVQLGADDWAEERTRITQTRPWAFYLVRKSGESKSTHQIRASGYAESCNPYMPSAALFAETGNPYPANLDAAGNVVSSPKFNHYRAFAVLGHVIFDKLSHSDAAVSAESLYYDTDVVEAAAKLIGKPINKPAAAEDNYILNAITCILRELELCGGHVMALGSKRDRKTMWKPLAQALA
jgi:hypothetical protein